MRRLALAAILTLLITEFGSISMMVISDESQQVQSATIKLIPSTLLAEPGQIFKVAVVVENVADLMGFGVQFSYDTAYLEYINHTDPMPIPAEDYNTPIPPSSYGGILTGPVLQVKNDVNITKGTYTGAALSLGTTFSGGGTIATITFRTLDQQGTTSLQFIEHDLSNPKAEPIPKLVMNTSVSIWKLSILIIAPENRTYSLDSVPLTFNLGKPASWIGYSLDGQSNETISGNLTLDGLSDGTHVIAVYANDTIGNEGRSMDVHFMIDTTPPIITIASPENKTYETNSVPVNLTISELTSWIGYSLDGHANTTISGSFALSGLSNGLHSLVVYANDTAGNTGSSLILQFTIEKAGLELFPVTVAAVAVITVVGVFAGWLYLAKVRKGKDAKASTGKKTDLAAAIVE